MMEVKIGDYIAELDELEEEVIFTSSLLKKVSGFVKLGGNLIYACEDDFGIPIGYSSKEYGRKWVKVSKDKLKVGDQVKIYFTVKNLKTNSFNTKHGLLAKVKEFAGDRFKIEGQLIWMYLNDEGTSWEKVE